LEPQWNPRRYADFGLTAKSLTELSVRKCSPKSARYEIWDTRVAGLGLRVSPSGIKSYFVSYRFGGVRKRHTVGRHPEVSLNAARTRALEIRAMVSRDEDPEPKEFDRHSSFEETLPLFINLHCELKNKPSTIASTRRLLERECLPIWKNKPVADITRREVNLVLDKMVARGSAGAANKARAAMSKFFRWCVSRDLIASSPCEGVEPPTTTKKRERVLDDDEIVAVWNAADQAAYPFGIIVKLLLLTAQRRSEVSGMRWSELDLKGQMWTLPSERTKNSVEHHLPLSPTACQILRNTPNFGHDLLFPARGRKGTSFSGFGKCKERLDQAIQIPHWTLHDLRRTATTKMAELEVMPHVAERVLNHSSGQLGGVAGIYNRHKYLNSMRLALFAWDDHILTLLGANK